MVHIDYEITIFYKAAPLDPPDENSGGEIPPAPPCQEMGSKHGWNKPMNQEDNRAPQPIGEVNKVEIQGMIKYFDDVF